MHHCRVHLPLQIISLIVEVCSFLGSPRASCYFILPYINYQIDKQIEKCIRAVKRAVRKEVEHIFIWFAITERAIYDCYIALSVTAKSNQYISYYKSLISLLRIFFIKIVNPQFFLFLYFSHFSTNVMLCTIVYEFMKNKLNKASLGFTL